MSSKAKYLGGNYEYLRAASTEKEECENVYSVVVDTTIRLCSRPSVLVVRSEVRQKGASEVAAPLCSYEGSWPNVQVNSWEAYLFQHYCKVTRLVQDSLRDEGEFWEGQKQGVGSAR